MLVRKDQLLSANALITTGWNVMLVGGPVVAGAIFSHYGPRLALWLAAVAYLLSVGFFFVIAGPEREGGEVVKADSGWLSELRQGLGYARCNRAVLVILGASMLASMGGAAYAVLEVIFVKDVLGAGDQGYGLLISVCGVGGLVGAMLVGRVGRRLSPALLYPLSEVLNGLSLFLYANILFFPATLVIVFFSMLMEIFVQVSADTLLQSTVPEGILGRVYALLGTGRSAAHIAATASFGPLIDLLGVVPIFNLAGGMFTLAGVFALANLQALRRAEGEPTQAIG